MAQYLHKLRMCIEQYLEKPEWQQMEVLLQVGVESTTPSS